MPSHHVDPESCTCCGLCAGVCPSYVYELSAEMIRIRPEMASHCVQCGHCMAICPTQAVSVAGFDYSGFEDAPETVASAEDLRALMRHRRAMRAFTPNVVPRALLEQVVEAAATAPMGFPPSGVEVTVLPMRQHIEPIVPATVKMVEGMQKMLGSGLGRFIFRRMAGVQMFTTLNDYLMPLMPMALERYRESGEDFVTWGAPAMLVFHVAPTSASGIAEAMIAATQAMLMAEALGLGTIMLGLAAAAIGRDAELMKQYAIPPGNQVCNALALGYPDRRFDRTIPRELKSVSWIGG